MHDLIPLEPAAAVALATADTLTQAEIERVLGYAEAAKAPASLLAYASDWRDFAAWCASRAPQPWQPPRPWSGGYISTLAHSGLKASTLGRRIAAIAHVHSQHGHKPSPTADETVRGVFFSLAVPIVRRMPFITTRSRRQSDFCGLSASCASGRMLARDGRAASIPDQVQLHRQNQPCAGNRERVRSKTSTPACAVPLLRSGPSTAP
jgi:hypothetical protein